MNEALLSVLGSLAVAVLGLGVALSRVREKVARLEEWVRQQERRNGQGHR